MYYNIKLHKTCFCTITLVTKALNFYINAFELTNTYAGICFTQCFQCFHYDVKEAISALLTLSACVQNGDPLVTDGFSHKELWSFDVLLLILTRCWTISRVWCYLRRHAPCVPPVKDFGYELLWVYSCWFGSTPFFGWRGSGDVAALRCLEHFLLIWFTFNRID